MITLKEGLGSVRASGSKAIIPYITGGLDVTGSGTDWIDAIRASIDAGASAIEIGIPFSDPVMDGPVIQRANDIALGDNTNLYSIAQALKGFDSPVPLAVMTYYNIAYKMGLVKFAELLVSAGITGAIIPDLPMEEVEPFAEVAQEAGLENVLLVAPTSTDERVEAIGEKSRGFVYAVGLVGITGARETLAASATKIAARAKAKTDLPVLIGVGIGSPEAAVQACEIADGVIIGSTVVQRLLDGEGAAGVGKLIAQYRSALDANYSSEG